LKRPLPRLIFGRNADIVRTLVALREAGPDGRIAERRDECGPATDQGADP
jgi:hypothetical protein